MSFVIFLEQNNKKKECFIHYNLEQTAKILLIYHDVNLTI
jgi:hypothetical protein